MRNEELLYDDIFTFFVQYNIIVQAYLMPHHKVWICTLKYGDLRFNDIFIPHYKSLKNTIDLWKSIKAKIRKEYSFILPILLEEIIQEDIIEKCTFEFQILEDCKN